MATIKAISLDIVLLPSGHLRLAKSEVSQEDEITNAAVLPETLISPLSKAFEKGPGVGLLHLAGLIRDTALPPIFSYWQRFGERYITDLCHISEPSENLKTPLTPPHEDLTAMAADAPPMRGGEYMRTETLENLWVDMDAVARAEIAKCSGGLSEWIRARNPLWQRLGRVCFHLAENKRDPERPFAFLATYAPRLINGQRVQYQPLGRALEEYAVDKNKKTLVNLLTPIERAAERCAWVKSLVDSGEVFHPLRWATDEAYRFLKDVPQLEESGLLVRVPDWWTKRLPRVQVSVSIGETKQSMFDVKSMLDFKVRIALEGENLSEEEFNQIIQGQDGLVFLKGRWVEVDRDKLKMALEHWKKVERESGENGVSFIEGMRLLAGTPLDPVRMVLFENDCTAWSEVHAGPWLAERLRALRQPPSLEKSLPESELRACLRPYQMTGVEWLHFLVKLGLGACLADDMGLGKTVQTIALLLLMKREKKNGNSSPALIVMPASLLANWKSEMDRFAPTIHYKFAHPSQTRMDELKNAAVDPRSFMKNADAVFTTYGMITRIEWLSSVPWSVVVLDEAQAIKNPSARQTRAVKQLKAGARVVLTGTPVENRLTDLWSIFDFLCPGLLGSAKMFGDFVKRMEDREQKQYSPLRRLVSPYILRRLKSDKSIIADLPDKTEVKAFCHLTKKQAALYQRSVRELADSLSGADGIRRRGVILSFILRFKQICNHPAQWLGSGGYAPEESGKFVRLRELCEEIAARQEKALVFTQFREMTEPIAGFLKTVFGRTGLVLHGEIPVKKRKALVDDFQNEYGPPFFVLSLKAGGSGLNLTAASHVLHFDRWWNPAVENQATDRAFRIGQKKNVVVHKFVCRGTIEEKIDLLIQDKTVLSEEILESGVPKLITEMGDKELLDMVKLDASMIGEE